MSFSILMIASEAVPFSKTGGLADVLGALPSALVALGHDVTVVLPRYRDSAAGEIVAEFDISLGGRTARAAFHQHQLNGVSFVLVDVPELYDREALYGIGNDDYPDNAFRFAFLARAALEYGGRLLPRVDVVHAHDWQAGLAPVYLSTLFGAHPVFARAATVFTIHNLAYQGLFGADLMPALDLDWRLFAVEGLEYWGKISFLKAGVNFSRLVTTVSPTYAKEIQTPEFGFGFDGILKRKGKDLVGILNGIDATAWDPMTDPNLPAPYSTDDLSGKREAKRALLDAFGMPTDDKAMGRALVALVSRMVDQKGFDLLSGTMHELLRLEATYVLLGNGDPRYEAEWHALAGEYPDRVGARIGFDDQFAHLVEAGADIFLMPSRFEPCGLNQMYSLRYGTVPVVRATGGLDDTVVNYRGATGQGTGFKFKGYTGRALVRALECALDVYKEPSRWRAIQLSGMKQDYSWAASARAFGKVYDRARRAVTNR